MQDQAHKQHGTDFYGCSASDQGRRASIATKEGEKVRGHHYNCKGSPVHVAPACARFGELFKVKLTVIVCRNVAKAYSKMIVNSQLSSNVQQLISKLQRE
jgi:hypothetical protein